MSEPTGLQVMLDQWDERGMAAQAYPETFIAAFVKAARLVANMKEQTRTVMGQNDDGTPNGKDYTERRFVSEWKATEHHDYLLSPFFPALTPGDTK